MDISVSVSDSDKCLALQDKDRDRAAKLAENSKRTEEQNVDKSEVQLPKVFLIALPTAVQVA